MKPKVRTLKQAGRDHRFTSEIASILVDPLRQRLADRIRSGEYCCAMSSRGALEFVGPQAVYDYCYRCGCTHDDPCESGCAWAVQPRIGTKTRESIPGLCTACLTNDELCRRMGMEAPPRSRKR